MTAHSKPAPGATRRQLRTLLTALLAASALLVSWSTAGAWSTADGAVAVWNIPWGGGINGMAIDSSGNIYMTGL
ncbi:MAG: SBBP repeat-containing protein, partial [Acidimicrobiales bacterium]|nr:SBBP repeat-containing protein [Acidimicrobiales bacterium]